MAERRILVVGGGAAGFFGALACKAADPSLRVTILEATAHPLAKVRVSGGGRCNVTNACFEPMLLAANYPRGGREMLGPLTRFGPRETVEWFESRGVPLKAEADGRMFPITDDSATVIDCLMRACRETGVELVTRCGVREIARTVTGFAAALTTGEKIPAERVLLATGGNRGSAGLTIAAAMGHPIEPPVPSLFTFHCDDPLLRGLEGLSVASVAVRVPGTKLSSDGPILITHWGLSGPAILKLSAWGARELHASDYKFSIRVNWAAPATVDEVERTLANYRREHQKRHAATANPCGLPARLWDRLVAAAGVASTATWTTVSNASLRRLGERVGASEFAIAGKSLNKEEFVTCGGVRLREVDIRTMESRLVPGLHFAGEVLDIDGVTGGFNFQAAWTTGWHAGRAMGGAAGAEV
ncbi:MAG TPA: NAD(P)/FAD-dependent oxidoreductase [Opitutaceae bacterium]|nr:NAD(P)/FAD-dependent oxidoreductase [Opitutaceae bacterium]